MKSYTFKTSGTCATSVKFDIDNGVIKNIEFENGCSGNTNGISLLAEGMNVQELIKKLEGAPCNKRGTSCPDQLAQAVKKAVIDQQNK